MKKSGIAVRSVMRSASRIANAFGPCSPTTMWTNEIATKATVLATPWTAPMREGIPLRAVVIGSVVGAMAVIAATIGYFFWLRAHVLQRMPMEIRILGDSTATTDLIFEIERARAKGSQITLSERALHAFGV